MTFNWGHGIFLFYSFFAATLVIVVIKSTGFDNSLVAEDYYARDLNYQSEYDRRVNSEALVNSPVLARNEAFYQLEFPVADLKAVPTGNVLLYRPSSNRFDVELPLTLDEEGVMNLPVQLLVRGRYRVIVEWEAGTTEYLDEFSLDVAP